MVDTVNIALPFILSQMLKILIKSRDKSFITIIIRMCTPLYCVSTSVNVSPHFSILIFVFLIRSNRSTYFFLRVSGFFFRYFFKFHLIIWFGNKWNVSNPCSYLFPFQERLPNFYFFFYRSYIRFKWIQYNKNRIRFNDRGRWEAIHRWAGIS